MRHSLAIAVVLYLVAYSFPVAAQCAGSNVRVAILDDPTPGCVSLSSHDAQAVLIVDNRCGEDEPFHLQAGVGCPYCDPPLLLNPGTFGQFAPDNRPLSAFSVGDVPTQYVLDWSSGTRSGDLTVEVQPHIIECPPADAGLPDVGADVADTAPDEAASGCCATTGARTSPHWLVMLIAFAFGVRRTTSRERVPGS